MTKCNLIYPNTGCIGRVLKRNLYGNAYTRCCTRHYQIFKLLQDLIAAGYSMDDLRDLTPDALMELLND